MMGRKSLFCFLSSICALLSSCSQNARTAAPAAELTPPTLEDSVRASLDFDKFNPTILDERLVVLSSSGSSRTFFTRQDVQAFHSHVRENHEQYEVAAFNVLEKDNETDQSHFASITYKVSWKISVDGKNARTSDVISHEIWERTVDGWHRVFAAMDH